MTTNKKIDIEDENICQTEQELEIPNAETIAAIKELENTKDNPAWSKGYTDIRELMRDLMS